MTTLQEQRNRAVGRFVTYFKLLARHAGVPWDPDYTKEIGEAVDAILRIGEIERAIDRGHAMELTARIDRLEAAIEAPDGSVKQLEEQLAQLQAPNDRPEDRR